MKGLSLAAKLYILAFWGLGVLICLQAPPYWDEKQFWQFLFYFVLAVVTSKYKVQLPGVLGNISVNFVFILVSVTELSLLQTVTVGWGGTAAQTLFGNRTRVKPAQMAFNLSQSTVASAATWTVYQALHAIAGAAALPIVMIVVAGVYYLLNTFSIAGIIALTTKDPVLMVWRQSFVWMAPHYLIGAGVATFIHVCQKQIGWQYSVLVLPIIYVVYSSYRLYLNRLSDEKIHVSEVAELHLRTIEALALAIEAKDDTTQTHLRRLQTYATEIARELELSKEEIKALEAAALLHDIGKLAVPDYILSKPGRLTSDEFEKIKVHPIVGAEILECVDFPYPVVPIVRSHHEKWDGTGYPDGLKAEEIPIGARILSVVDCLDAMSSDRQYRPGIPLGQAMDYVVSQSGKSFDPRVVEILQRRYLEMEHIVRVTGSASKKLGVRPRVAAGTPAVADPERVESALKGPDAEIGFISAIAQARQEFQLLHEATRDLGNSLSVEETLSMLSKRLQPLLNYDAIAIYQLNQNEMTPQYVSGEDQSLFSKLRIPLGQGLSGWVAENKRPIVNGNPAVEAGYLRDPRVFTNLRSALSVPLEAMSGVVGALTIYSRSANAFSRDHLRLLLAISSKAALTIENALKYNQANTRAGTDQLTGLLNTQSLFVQLDRQLENCKLTGTTLTVMVLDMDGFKQVNDRFGHLVGNELLILTADGLRAHCRQSDSAARMGGDEFAVILPGLTQEAAREKALAFRKAIIDAGRQVTGEDFVSASIGVAFYPADGTEAEQLLAEADRQMYVAKKAHHEQKRQSQRPNAGPAQSPESKEGEGPIITVH